MTPVPPTFWTALESVPGATALPTTWTHHIAKSDFDTFKVLFLTSRPDALAPFVPCPWNCGCLHKVVPRENGTLAGVCQCNPANCTNTPLLTTVFRLYYVQEPVATWFSHLQSLRTVI